MPDAPLSSYSGLAWRLVEAQHVVSTLKLVDDLAEQAVLEDILEAAKPALPEACAHLHYLLSTPFRYRPYPHGSRFRRTGHTPGVWYGAETVETSVAELAFYRALFYAESPETPFPASAAAHTAFSVPLEARAMADTTRPPLDGSEAWTDPIDYAPCQRLADAVRARKGDLIRYVSVRDPYGRAALAVLDCAVFAATEPQSYQSWHLRMSRGGVIAVRDFPRAVLAYAPDAFADPRLAGMVWAR